MRVMDIPPFPTKIENLVPDDLFKSRLSEIVVMWPEQAISLLGYMCYPNDPAAREALQHTLQGWMKKSATPLVVPKGLRRVQHDWLRVADIIHTHYDLVEGQHQARRGGPSIGKAITLVEANAESWGTGASTLWKDWSIYKDVAHLVAAATLICADARLKYRNKPFEPVGLRFDQFIPFQMTMLVPDLVLAVGLEFQRVGLSAVPHARAEPPLYPETLWRIPEDINVAPLPPPPRKIGPEDVVVLNDRRAGNRGKAKVSINYALDLAHLEGIKGVAGLTDPIFHDEAQAIAHMEAERWPDGIACPLCGTTNVHRMGGKTQAGMLLCNECRGKFTVRTGTILQRSHIPLHKWLLATHIMAASTKIVSALQFQRILGLGSYRSAWCMCRRIRTAINPGKGGPISGTGLTTRRTVRASVRDAARRLLHSPAARRRKVRA
jgi:transposase-like protein